MMEFHFSILLMVIAECSASVLLPEEDTHAISCLKRISQLYFTTLSNFIIILPDVEETSTHRDRYLLNTNSPSTTTDMAQSLLTEINSMNKLVFVIQPELLDLENITTWLQVPGPLYTNDVIIVFFTYNNFKTAITKFMHSKAELLIILIVTSEYDDFRGPVFQKCLEIFAKAQLFNVLILKPGFHVTKSKERVVKALHLYSWYSNYTIPNCGVKDNPVKVNTWLLDEGGKFVDKPEFFPEVVASGFKGCRIYVRKFVRSDRYVGFNVFMERMGYMFLNIAAKALGIEVRVREPHDDQVIDVYMDILSLKSLTTFSNSRPTSSFREITLKWHVPCPESVSRHGNFIRVFKYPTWLLLFLVAILFGLIIQWLYKNCKDLEMALDFSSTLLKIWGILTGVSVDIGTDNYKVRMAFFIWVLFCLIISTVFQAFFTGFLIDPGMHLPISNIKELNRTGITRAVPFEEYDFLLYSLTESDVFSLSNAGCTLDVCWYFYLSRRNFSFLADMLLMNPMLKGTGYKTCALDDHAVRVYTTFYIPRNNYFFKIINEIVTRITEAGIPGMVERSILRDMRTDFVSPSGLDEDESDEYFIFGMHHLKLIFYSLAIGYVVGLITFAFEKLHYKLNYQRVKQF
ncbi:Ionotropic receptor 692 [Blattella germanica]|nr:Ionotropic receptor 692 [Blattella germanica]